MNEWYDDFVAAYQASHKVTFYVALWLYTKWDVDICVPKKRIMPRDGDYRDYSDSCDLIANGKKIEVKHKKKHHFTDKDNYPFPSMMLAGANHIEKHWNETHAYIIVNDDMTHVFVVKSDTKQNWWKDKTKAYNRDHNEIYYYCNIDDGKFYNITL